MSSTPRTAVARSLFVGTTGLLLAAWPLPPSPAEADRNDATSAMTICSGVGVAEPAEECPAWTARYDGAGENGPDFPNEVVVSPDGGTVFVGGYELESGDFGIGTASLTLDYDLVVAAYDAATGQQRWVTKYDGPGHARDETVHCGGSLGYGDARCFAISPDGATVFLTGRSRGTEDTGYDYATLAVDTTTGALRWASRYNNEEGDALYDYPGSLVVSPDGSRVYVTGRTYASNPGEGGTGWDVGTVAYDAATGQELWVARYDNALGASIKEDAGRAIAVAPDGSRVYVLASSVGDSPLYDYATIAYLAEDPADPEAEGRQLWVARYSDPNNGVDEPSDIVANDDRVFVTGWADGGQNGTGADFLTAAYEAGNGDVAWVQRFTGPATPIEATDFPTDAALSPDGARLYITGISYFAALTDTDYLTVAHDTETGEPVWARRYDGGYNDFPYGLALTADGKRLYVTGASYGAGNYDMLTIAYDAPDATPPPLNWIRRYDAALAADHGRSVVVSADGTQVFVTGESDGQLGGTRRQQVANQAVTIGDDMDWLTMAYSA